MFCPQCSQERTSETTSFCSQCGFLLTGTADLLQTGGAPLPPPENALSPRSRGIRQGLSMFLLTFLIAPILGIISVFGFGIVPWPMGIVILILGVGGLLRIAYAMMYESKYPISTPEDGPGELNTATATGLPPKRDLTASEYTTPTSGRWLDTNDLEPTSVTDNTTKLLEKDADRISDDL